MSPLPSDTASLRAVPRLFFLLLGLAALLLGPVSGAAAQTAPLPITSPVVAADLVIPVSKSQTLQTDRPVRDVLVGNPEIADVTPLTDRTLHVIGKQIGSTSLRIYDRGRNLISVLNVVVTYDIDGLKASLGEVLPNERVEIRPVGDALILSGTVSSADQAARATQLAERVAPGKVTNFLTVAGSQQVMLSVRFVEMQRSLARDLGLRSLTGSVIGGNQTTITPVRVPAVNALAAAEEAVNPGALLGLAGALLDGRFGLSGTFDALETKGLLRTLAEPNLIALSGESASFLAGGEFPVPVAQAQSGGGTTITVEFKPFGVSLGFTPTVLGNGLISLSVVPEVSQIDPSSSVTISGFRIFGLSTRRAATTVELRDGQSFAIAGLLQSDFQDTINQVPGLAEVPILGGLFRSSTYQRRETELVIIVTPHLVRPVDPVALAVPGANFVIPTFFDLHLLGQTAGPAASPASLLSGQSAAGMDGMRGHVIR